MANDEAQSSYFGKVLYRHATDPLIAAYARPKLDFLGRHLPIERTTSILDVGCGNGAFTHHLAQLSDEVTGVDTSEHLLRQNPHPRVELGDATELPFADASFDLVFEASLLHHVAERESVVAEMRRVSRRYLAFVEPNVWNPLMLGFGLLVPEERGLLRSSRRSLLRLLARCGVRPLGTLVTGMISQNNTPPRLVPFLRRFDAPIWWGEYVVIAAERG